MGTFLVIPLRIEVASASLCLQFDAVQGKLIPFDVSQARISLGPKLACTIGQPRPCRCTLESAPFGIEVFSKAGISSKLAQLHEPAVEAICRSAGVAVVRMAWHPRSTDLSLSFRRLLRYIPCIGDTDGDDARLGLRGFEWSHDFSSKAHLSDEFLPHGFHELVSEAASASGTAVLRQIPPFGFNAMFVQCLISRSESESILCYTALYSILL